jgi:ABC-type multidrug transport system fused ATPase/permease subunit
MEEASSSSSLEPESGGTTEEKMKEDDIEENKKENDDEDDLVSSFRRASRTGSMLHRNSERRPHLRRLLLKRQLRERFDWKSFKNEEDEAKVKEEMTKTLLILDSEEGTMMRDLLQQMMDEVKQEEEATELSSKIRELENMVAPYELPGNRKILSQYPLEVRIQNVTYSVHAAGSSGLRDNIQTVYNTSCLYSIRKWIRRVSQCQPVEKVETPRKNILKDIRLIIQPGRQYLVLGPPASGKSTLLKTIAGLITVDKDRSLQGTVEYNGRTLEVRKKENRRRAEL